MSEVPETQAQRWAKAGRLKKTLPVLGEEVTVRRLNREALLMSPRLPGSLTARVARAFEDATAGSPVDRLIADTVTVEQMLAMPDIVNAVLIHTLDEPLAVLEAADPAKNQINVSDIPDDDRLFLFRGAMNDWPEMPVETEGGEVNLEDLAEFHSVGEGVPHASGGEGVQGSAQ